MRLLTSFILFLFITTSCRRDQTIGKEVQIGSNTLLLTTTDSIHISASTLQAKPERTDERFSGMLGNYRDPIFGSNIISYHSQFFPQKEHMVFPAGAILDSAFLNFKLTGAYRNKALTGNEYTNVSLQVFELSQDLNISSVYLSNATVSVQPNAIGEYIGPVNLVDSIFTDSVTYIPPQIRIPLNQAWAERILSTDSINLATNENFVSFMKGLSVKSTPVNDGLDGAIFYFDPYSRFTGISFHYHTDTDTTSFSFLETAKTANFMTFDHNYAETSLAFGDTAIGSNILYLQSTIGTNVEIELNDIITKFSKDPKIINIAELFIPVDTNQPYFPSNQLSISRKVTNGMYEFLPDQLESGSRFIDGNLNSDSSYYRFLITQYVQNIILDYIPGVTQPEKLLINSSGNITLANRSIISGPRPTDPNSKPMKIVISFTPKN